MFPCPRKYPPEFKRDVVAVARRGELNEDEIAADFGISVESVRRWIRQAEIGDGISDGITTAEQNEPVQLRREKRRLEMENETLRRFRRFFARDMCPKLMFPLVQELAADGIPVRLTCGVLGFSPQAFFKWRARPVCDRDWDDAHLGNAIVYSTQTVLGSATGLSRTNSKVAPTPSARAGCTGCAGRTGSG